MKKVLMLFLAIFICTGCQNLDNYKYEDIVKQVISNNNKIYNVHRTGYKYYLPSKVKVDSIDGYNEVLSTADTNYYLYVDLISYYHKEEIVCSSTADAYFYYEINENKKSGCIEIRKQDDNFIVEMAYNYAKIELVTSGLNMKEDILRSMNILTSIKFNDSIVNNLIGENTLDFKEIIYNVSKSDNKESDFLESAEEYEVYDGQDVEIPDYDVIN